MLSLRLCSCRRRRRVRLTIVRKMGLGPVLALPMSHIVRLIVSGEKRGCGSRGVLVLFDVFFLVLVLNIPPFRFPVYLYFSLLVEKC
jgi:hypothetical protein